MLNRSYIQEHQNHPHYLSDAKFLSLQKDIVLSHEENKLISIIKNISDPTKFKIYSLLQQVEEISVTDLSLILDLSQSAVSHAMADLKNLGLVQSQRCGQLICYSLSSKKLWI